MTPEERRKLNEVHAFMQAMQRYDKMPLAAEQAMARRLKIRTIPLIQLSSKSLNSEDVNALVSAEPDGLGGIETVAEAVLADPEAWLMVDLGGTTYHIPAFT